MNPALESRQDAIMRNISASCVAASFIALFWCIFLSQRCHDYGIFLISPRSPCVPGALQLQPSAGCACEQQQKKERKKSRKKKQENKSPTRNLKNLCSEAFNDCKVAPFLQAGRQEGREGGREARRRGAHRDLQRSERSSLQGLLVC